MGFFHELPLGCYIAFVQSGFGSQGKFIKDYTLSSREFKAQTFLKDSRQWVWTNLEISNPITLTPVLSVFTLFSSLLKCFKQEGPDSKGAGCGLKGF